MATGGGQSTVLPDGRTLLFLSFQRSAGHLITAWDNATGTLRWTFKDEVQSLDVSPDGGRVALVHAFRTGVTILDTLNGHVVTRLRLNGDASVRWYGGDGEQDDRRVCRRGH